MQPAHRRQCGYSLIELMIAVAVVGVLCTIASSAAGSAMNAARAADATSRLIASITRARNFAANYGAQVVLCPSRDGRTCTEDDWHWEGGWIGFVDSHGDGEHRAGEPLLLGEPALGQRVRLITSSGRTRIRFQPNGSNAGSNATFTLCDGRGASRATALVMANNSNLHRDTPSAERAAEACAR